MTTRIPVTTRVLVPLLAALVLMGCLGPQLYQMQLSALDKGITTREVAKRLTQESLGSYTASANGRTFQFHKYKLYNGVYADLYVLAYEQDRLVYWGYVSEFRRHPDNDLVAALDQAYGEMIER